MMKPLKCLLLFVIGCGGALTANGQLPANTRACTAGTQADGFLNFEALPMGQAGVPLDAVVPITGAVGLTVEVKIPATPGIFGNTAITNYGVNSAVDLYVATGADLTLIFNRPVRGVSALIANGGRFQRSATMSAYSDPSLIAAGLPPSASTTTFVFDFPSGGDSASTPLQIRSETASIGVVVFHFPADIEHQIFDVENVRVESGAGPDESKSVPMNGLKQWLRADSIYAPFAGVLPFPTWPDQSGNHNDASRPEGIESAYPSGPNCAAVVPFKNTGVSANLPINGWTGMTVFLVSSSTNDINGWWQNQPLFWGETALWGTTFFTPTQTSAYFRFGTTQVNNQPIYTRPVDVGGDLTLMTAIHEGNSDRMYLNGLLALEEGGKRAAIAGTSSTEQIGFGLLNTFFNGGIGEILIYDRALNDRERERVEHYLMKKFGLF